MEFWRTPAISALLQRRRLIHTIGQGMIGLPSKPSLKDMAGWAAKPGGDMERFREL